MRLIAFLLIFLGFHLNSRSQQPVWQGTAGGADELEIVDTDHDDAGNLYVAGFFEDQIDLDISSAQSIIHEGSGLHPKRYFVAKYSSTGALIWTIHTREKITAIDIASNGLLGIVGTFRDSLELPGITELKMAQGYNDIYYAKYTLNGQYTASKVIRGLGEETSGDIQFGSNGEVYLSGIIESIIDTIYLNPLGVESVSTHPCGPCGYSPRKAFYVKYDQNGSYLWHDENLATMYCDNYAPQFEIDLAGDLYVFYTGCYSEYPWSLSYTRLKIIKYSSDGILLWTHNISGEVPYTYFGLIRSVETDADGSVYVLTDMRDDLLPNPMDSSIVLQNVYEACAPVVNPGEILIVQSALIKFDSDGNYVWSRVLSEPPQTLCCQFASFGTKMAIANNSIYVSGSFIRNVDFELGNDSLMLYNFNTGCSGSTPSESNSDAFVAAFDTSGNIEFAISYGGLEKNRAWSIEPDGNGNIYTVGKFSGAIDLDPASTIQMVTESGNSQEDFFITKLKICDAPQSAPSLVPSPVCSGDTVYPSGQGVGNVFWSSDLATGVGFTSSESEVYQAIVLDSSGCSKEHSVFLDVIEISEDTVSTEICQGATISHGGGQITTAGFHEAIFGAVNGCDSISVLDVSIIPTAYAGSLIEICSGESYLVNGVPQSQSGVYYESSTSSLGCDSVTTVFLTVHQPVVSNEEITICEGESYEFAGQELSMAGVYTDTLASQNGCDSVNEFVLNVEAAANDISNVNGTLSANPANDLFQWYNCETDELIVSETAPNFTPQSSGSYKVVVSNAGCTDTSSCEEVFITGISKIGEEGIKLYPNPAKNLLTVEFPILTELELVIYDHAGRVLLVEQKTQTSWNIQVDQLAAGHYFISASSPELNWVSAFSKID